MELKRIVVASSNKGKIAEIKDIFKGVEIISMSELGFNGDIEEYGTSFSENAEIKAKFISEKFNCVALADDSGLCVEALGLAPGIFSARFSGLGDKGNRDLLLKELDGIDNRSAYFESSVCLYFPDGKKLFGNGRTYGKILLAEEGKNGFGYDCLFYSLDLNKSFGLATAQEKNFVSHRFRALSNLRNLL